MTPTDDDAPVVRRSSERTLQVAERDWPAEHRSADTDVPGLAVFHVRQSLVMFETGTTVSVVWGDATYSSNHDCHIIDDDLFTDEPMVVEVGMWDQSEVLHVLAYVSAVELADILDAIHQGMNVDTILEAWESAGRSVG